MIATPWPNLTLYARLAGEIDPYAPENAHLFRGEEAFTPDVQGWRRWSKPSPEPQLDDTFETLLLESIARHRARVAGLIEKLADRVAASAQSPPLLVAILRAGVPVGALLARSLARRFGAEVPLVAISLFHGLGWDEAGLQAALADHPGRPVWFVDGWTSGGGVATELRDSFVRWLAAGRVDFTNGAGPRLAVLNDPRSVADAAAIRADIFVPSSCFTAPETLGFSRGFSTGDGGMFYVYRFPRSLLRPQYVEAWMAEEQEAGSRRQEAEGEQSAICNPQSAIPTGWRLHINEVVRALINRQPREVFLKDDEATAADTLATVLHLCRLRGVPVRYGCPQVAEWGAIAAARMTGNKQ